MKIIGGVLPFVGYRERDISSFEAVELGLVSGPADSFSQVRAEFLEAEWLYFGFTFYGRLVPDDRVTDKQIDEFASWYYFNVDERDPRVLMGRRICAQAKRANGDAARARESHDK